MSMSAVPIAHLDRARNIEAVVTEVLTTSLGGAAISPDDNFFEIGGTSLLLAIVLTELENRLSVEIPVGTFLENPSARGFAAKLHTMLEP